MADSVNHPAHYNSHPSGVECITITEHMTFNAGNAVKYLWRAGLKEGASHPDAPPNEGHIQDLRKAAWYINREILRLQPQTLNPITKAEINALLKGEYDGNPETTAA